MRLLIKNLDTNIPKDSVREELEGLGVSVQGVFAAVLRAQ
jgi:hypothetical protein